MKSDNDSTEYKKELGKRLLETLTFVDSCHEVWDEIKVPQNDQPHKKEKHFFGFSNDHM